MNYLDAGLPQGSVLGPLLLKLYLNELKLFVDCEFNNLFSDDTMIAGSDLITQCPRPGQGNPGIFRKNWLNRGRAAVYR